MADLDALARAGKQHGVIAHDVATANGGKADAAGFAGTGVAIALVHRAIGQGGVLRRSNDFAHFQGGARGGIHLVLVVGFDNFNVVIGQRLRGQLQQFEGDIHANTHIGGKNDGRLLCGSSNRRLARIVKTRGANDHFHPQLSAHLQVGQRAFRTGEINQKIGLGQGTAQIRFNRHTAALAQKGGGILAQAGALRLVEGRGQLAIATGGNGFNQHAAHAATGTGHGNAKRV